MTRTYVIKEIFHTLQGEGLKAGTKAVFLRLSGCNLWNGREEDRTKGSGTCAAFCDTDFINGSRMALDQVLDLMQSQWERGGVAANAPKWCVLTGGEPCLQVDAALLEALHNDNWRIAIETNGTIDNGAVREGCDHICVSPKRGTSWRALGKAHEIKVVLPGASPDEEGWTPKELEEMETVAALSIPASALFVQPQDPVAYDLKRSLARSSVGQCIEWVQRHPRWRLSLQTHKMIGLR